MQCEIVIRELVVGMGQGHLTWVQMLAQPRSSLDDQGSVTIPHANVFCVITGITLMYAVLRSLGEGLDKNAINNHKAEGVRPQKDGIMYSSMRWPNDYLSNYVQERACTYFL